MARRIVLLLATLVVSELNAIRAKLARNMIYLSPMRYHSRLPTGSARPQILDISKLRCRYSLPHGPFDSPQNPCSLFPAYVNHSPPSQPLPGQQTSLAPQSTRKL